MGTNELVATDKAENNIVGFGLFMEFVDRKTEEDHTVQSMYLVTLIETKT